MRAMIHVPGILGMMRGVMPWTVVLCFPAVVVVVAVVVGQ